MLRPALIDNTGGSMFISARADFSLPETFEYGNGVYYFPVEPRKEGPQYTKEHIFGLSLSRFRKENPNKTIVTVIPLIAGEFNRLDGYWVITT